MLLLEHIQLLSKEEEQKFLMWLSYELDGKDPALYSLAANLLAHKQDSRLKASDAISRVQRSKLLSRLQEFISIETFRKDRAQQDNYFIQAIFERKKIHLFPKFLKKAKKRLKNQFAPSALYFSFLFKWEFHHHVYVLRKQPKLALTRKPITQRLGPFVQWIKHEASMLGLHFLQEPSQNQAYSEILAWLNRRRLDEDNSAETNLYFALADLFNSAEDASKLKEIEHQVLSLLKSSDVSKTAGAYTDMQGTAINYFIRKADRLADEVSYLQLIDLYAWMLQNDFMPFTVRTFRTISMTYLHVAWLNKKTERGTDFLKQAYHFMHKYQTYLPQPERKSALAFMDAYGDFIGGNYEKVAKGEVFRSGSSFDPYYEYGYWFIFLQAEYELGNYNRVKENLRHLKDRLRKRKGLLERNREIYLNRLRFFAKLLRLKRAYDLKKMAADVE